MAVVSRAARNRRSPSRISLETVTRATERAVPVRAAAEPNASKFSLTLDRSSGAFFVVVACAAAVAPAMGFAALFMSQARFVAESELRSASSLVILPSA